MSLADRSPLGLAGFLARTEVQPAGELAENQQVDALEELRPQRRGWSDCRVHADRTEVREEPESAAQLEQGLLGAHRRVRVVPFRPADRAEEDRIDVPAGVQILVAEGHAVRVDRRAADQVLRPGNLETKGAPDRVQDATRSFNALQARRRRRGAPRYGTWPQPPSWQSLFDARRDERNGHAVDLGTVELVDRHEVRLERGLDDVGR